MTFFGPIAPDLITVKTGPGLGEEVQVPFGMFTLPGVENAIETKRKRLGDRMVLMIVGRVRKREAPVVRELANIARQLLTQNSIYKGKAIRLKVDSDGDLVQSEPPTFLQTAYINPDELVLNPDELEQVKAALWAPVENTEACMKHRIPLKRGVLLEGTYGTGKTMTANVTSRVCVDNGWTYILLDDVRALKEALLFAQRYQPAVVFAEDAERVAEHRDQRGNDLLNTIDGVLAKNSQVITVLTTNYVEKLDSAMLRPGRLDAVISIRPPEAGAVERLIRR
jgi:transitional endoplasmic reticulum ATPase